uniref:Cell wall protein DAN4-like n=1 Tax=Labrus bergylta TaxID=56723 RepID=A0A3Q3FNE6_9LABR
MRMQLSINAPVVLLWGIFSLFSTVAMSAPNTENNMYTTGEPNKTTTQLSANVHNVTVTHQTHTPAEGGVATTKEMEIATITNNSSDVRSSDLVVTKSVAATTGGLLEGLLHSSAAATTTEAKSPNSMEITDSQPCSSRGVVKHCLIAIASLAGLATFFMVTTITLCTKLSTSRYRVRRPPQATEMMCISSLLPERNYTYTRQRNPVSNGVLVMHAGGDSDEEGGDNLTLSSFLPENDHLV